jgi:hypothetical protein
MTHVVFINTQAFGDCIFGINAARRYKEEHPDHLVSYCLTNNFNLTTNDGPTGTAEALEVLEKQLWLDAVGLVTFSPQGQIQSMQINRQEPEFKQVDSIIMHYRWFSDLGISRSTNHPIKHLISKDSYADGNIQLVVGSEKPKDDIIRIGIAGPLDWNRKLQSEALRIEVLQGIKQVMDKTNKPYEVTMFGVEMANYTLHQTLMLLNRQSIFIAPTGSLIHAAAALDVDTITIGSVFPAEYESPEYYMTRGRHFTVKATPNNHCDTFKCVIPKNSEDSNNSPGNPPATLGFWPRLCTHTSSGLSCTKTYTADQIMHNFERWVNGV